MSENRETELVRLWVTNDQGPYEYAVELAREVAAEGSEYPAVELADRLRDWHEEAMPETEGVWSDLLGLAFGRVDWVELASEFLEDVEEEEEEEEEEPETDES